MKILKIEEKVEKIKNDERQWTSSLGGGGTKIGSIGVVTVNLPKLAYKYNFDETLFFENLKDLAEDCCKINHAKRNIVKKRQDSGNAPLYSLGFIDLKKQYSTIGVLGFSECLEIMGYNILSEDGMKFINKILDILNEVCDKAEKLYGYPHNCEQIPGENTAVKLAEKDKFLKYQNVENSYDLYSNQFIPLIKNADILDRIKLQGQFDNKFSGGSILHLNINNKINDAQKMKNMIKEVAKKGVIYHAYNYAIKQCEAGHVSCTEKDICECGKPITDTFTRVVGYLVNTKNFNKVRRENDFPNRVFYKNLDNAI